MPSSGATSKSSRGPRPKHVPQRTCVVCRETAAKRTLTRIVRVGDGNAEVDPTGRKNGRGAYVCESAECWERATSTPVLAKALRTEFSPETIERLKEFAAGLRTNPATQTAAADLKEQAQ